MSDISQWSNTANNNNTSAPDGFPEGMNPSGVNNAAREVMAAVRRQHENAQWIDLGNTPTYSSATTFLISGDVTTDYEVGRRVKIEDSTTLYGVISASTYSSPNTSVTVTLDSGSLSVSISSVALGILSRSNSALPTDIINVKDFGAVGDGVTNDSAAIQAAHDYLNLSGSLYFPAGTYLISTPIILKADSAPGGDGVEWYGDGDASIIYSNTDIEQVSYGNTTTTTVGLLGFRIRNMQFLRDTITTQTTFNIRITAAAACRFENLLIINPENDKANVAGIWLSKSSSMSYEGSVNYISGIRTNGGALFLEARDNKVYNSWFYGQNLQYSIKSSAPGNVFINVAVIPSTNSGGFVLGSNSQNNKLMACTVDGSVSPTETGHGIVADQAHGLQITSCDFYNVYSGHAIYFIDMLYTLVEGCLFKDNNRGDNSYDDIRLESNTFASSGNIIKGNSHWQSGSKINKGYGYNEVDGGSAPGANKVVDNNFTNGTGYQTTAINRINTGTEVRGNSGQNTNARRTGQISITAGTNPTGFISHGSPYDPPIADMKITPSNNWDGAGCTGWYLQRSSATVMGLFLRGTTTSTITFEWEVDSL